MQQPEDEQESCEILTSGNYIAVEHINSKQLWLLTQALQKIKPAKIPAWTEEGSQGHAAVVKLLVVDGCRERESLFFGDMDADKLKPSTW